jgi:hypothetical protein
MFDHSKTSFDVDIFNNNRVSELVTSQVERLVEQSKICSEGIVLIVLNQDNSDDVFLWTSDGKAVCLLSFPLITYQIAQYLQFSFNYHYCVVPKGQKQFFEQSFGRFSGKEADLPLLDKILQSQPQQQALF